MLDGAAHAAGQLLFAGTPEAGLQAAALDVAAACRLGPVGEGR